MEKQGKGVCDALTDQRGRDRWPYLPALALAEYALSADKDTAVLFVGTERGLESKIVPQAGFPLETIPAMGFQRQLKQVIPVLAVSKAGLARARKIIREYKPDVVLGTGAMSLPRWCWPRCWRACRR